MSAELLFPSVPADEGPAGLVDMLVGLHVTLGHARALVDDLVDDALVIEADPSREAVPRPVEQLVDVLLGLVSLGETVDRVLSAEGDAVEEPPAAPPYPKGDLLR